MESYMATRKDDEEGVSSPRKNASVDYRRDKELDEIKAKTMHEMVIEFHDGTWPNKLVYFTNAQAALFTIDNIPKLLDAFQFDRPKLVIWLMPCSGGSTTINHGMLTGFRDLDPTAADYTEQWKKLLRVQAVHDPDGYAICQDVLPIPPFLDEEELHRSEWMLECFMVCI